MTNLTATSVDKLVEIAATIANRAAVEYIMQHRVKVAGNDDVSALVECIRRHAKAAIGDAMRDAQEAFDCGMDSVGEQTFGATMALAGIAAAKEYAAA